MMNKLLKIFVVTTFFLSGFAFVNEAFADDIIKKVDCAKKPEKQWYFRFDSDDTPEMTLKKKELQKIMAEFQTFCKELVASGMRKEDLLEFHDTTYVSDVKKYVESSSAFKEKYEHLTNSYYEAMNSLETQRKCETNPFECMDAATLASTENTFREAQQNYETQAAAVDECDPNHWKNKWASEITSKDIEKLKKSGKCSQEQIATFEKAAKDYVEAEKALFGSTQTERLKQNSFNTYEQDAYAYTGAWQNTELAAAYKGHRGEAGLATEKKERYQYRGDNSVCDIAAMQQKYQGSCYSCKIILTLITTFMNACAKVYDLTREAGSKVLIIGSLIWMVVFSLQIVSSFTNQEPMSILNTFFIFMFKVTIAYIMLNAGVAIIINLFVNPLLMAGADYGIGLMQAANKDIINIATTTNYAYNGTEVISAKVINKLMALTQGIDKTVATNLVIGHALTCHSFNAGSITLSDFLDTVGFSIRIPDIWIWLCGAAIWFCGFMLTLGVGYYLLDVCFKIGFCIIALPIVIGLWPFSKTKDKFTSCMSIIFRSAGLFAFLALTVSYALTLISASLGDLTVFFDRIKANDHVWVSNTFSISGSQFIIIMFAYVYSIKMVGATVTGYLDKFFKDEVFGSASPIHHKATQMTDFAKKKVTQAASFAGGVVTHQATRAAGAAAGGTARMVKKGFQKGKSALSKSGNKPKNNE